jgi:thioredoxin-dependent peroxiredoxin
MRQMPQLQKAAPISAGALAPPFDLESSAGRRITLDEFRGKQTLVLYFYPKADTPGCTKQACGFRDALADYDKANIAVLGISPDPVAKVKKFADKFRLNFPLVADPDHAVAEKYGVWGEKRFMGRRYLGVARTTFVIAIDGTIRHVFENVKASGHDQEVLQLLTNQQRTL